MKINFSSYSYLLFSIVICFCINNNLLGQQKNLKFKHISLQEGLLHSDVQCIMQDSKGFIWIGTEDALSKYDGYQLKHYRNIPDDTLSISSNRIRAIVEDKTGDFWIGTEGGGLNKFNSNTETFIRYKHDPKDPKSIPDDIVRDLCLDAENNLWIGTGKGLCKLAGNEVSSNETKKIFTQVSLENGIDTKNSNRGIRAIYANFKGNIFVGTSVGFYILNQKNNSTSFFNRKLNSKNSLINNAINTFYEDNENRIWIGTENGLSIFNVENYSFENIYYDRKINYGLPDKFIISITQDISGNLWIGTNIGLSQITENKASNNYEFTNYQSDPLDILSINNNIIQCLYSDNSGVLWAGTREGGVNILDFSTQKFRLYNNQSGGKIKLIANSVWSFYEGEDGILWAGSRGGLNKIDFNSNKIEYFTHNPNDKNSIGSNNVFDVKGYKDEIWLALYGSGLSKLDIKTGKFTNYTDKENGIKSTVDLYINKNGDFLVGSFGEGLSIFNRIKETYTPIPIGSKNITDIFQDSVGNYWIGSDSKGVFRLNENFEVIGEYQNEPGNKETIVHNTVWGICSSGGYIWLATSGGLERVEMINDSIKFKHYFEDDGLSSNLIYSVSDDNDGNIWLGTSKGLSKFNPQNESFKNFDVKDGLQSNEFNAGAVHKNLNGELYFGGINGFNKFNPKELIDNRLIPKVYITNFKIANKKVPVQSNSKDNIFSLKKPISELKEIVLNYKQSFFSFEFVALNYKQSSKNQYAFYLDGFEEDWNFTNDRREAFYTNVPHGDYTFKVKASNNDGLWNEEGVSLKITITPPFWETLWFKFIVAFLVIGGSIGYYKYRMASIKTQNKRLEMKVLVRTKEIAAQKDEIESQAEELQQQAEELQQQRDHLSDANNAISLKNNEISKRLEDIKVLSEIGQKVTATVSIDEIITRVYENVNQLMDAPNFEIGLINEKLNYVKYIGFRSAGSDIFYASRELFKTNSLTALCVKRKEIIFVRDIEKDVQKYLTDQVQIDKIRNGEIKSFIYLPLFLESRIIGVLIVRSKIKNAYTEVYLDLLKNLGAYISIALDNANAYNLVEQKKQHITDSINSALSIQQAILPEENLMKDLLGDFFLIYRPKDIVSGDFYWVNEIDNKIYVCIVDCTGHGVPGAFMSMIGSSLLNRIILEKKVFEPSKILEELDAETKKSLKHNESHNREGMDLGICLIEKNENETVKLSFAGAKVSLFYMKENSNKIEVLKANRRSIGNVTNKIAPFLQHDINLNKGAQLYLATDGIIDQNNKSRKRFGSVLFKRTLVNNSKLTMIKQGENLEAELDNYQENEFQRDDITVLGVKI